MAGSLVVSDTTAITSLLKIGRSEILCELFSEVLVQPAVSRE
jgi:predicted nucleic acid-binding protein